MASRVKASVSQGVLRGEKYWVGNGLSGFLKSGLFSRFPLVSGWTRNEGFETSIFKQKYLERTFWSQLLSIQCDSKNSNMSLPTDQCEHLRTKFHLYVNNCNFYKIWENVPFSVWTLNALALEPAEEQIIWGSPI